MLEIENKIHDERIQGTALQAKPEDTKIYDKKFYIESYGCAMNFNDSEIVASILNNANYGATSIEEEADLILINTCSIREKAELTVRKRLTEFRKLKKSNPGLLVGVLGCMAERLKVKFLEEEKIVDLVIGPDAYRSLPSLIQDAETGQKAVNVLLSREETYADINPVRLDSNGVSAFVSIMRGCNNMCSFCVVPFTRGRERSRDAYSIVAEAQELFNNGYREVTLLGQNVDSYRWTNDTNTEQVSFAQLMEKVALISPLLRVRFSTSHPKDITDDVLHTIAAHKNICNYIHLPVQSGNTRILQIMNRNYTREWYIHKINKIREIIPNCGISSDLIIGFCTETEEEHKETLSLMEYCKYDICYMYSYSERPGTLAERRYKDDVPEEIKKRRLAEVVALHRSIVSENQKKEIGAIHEVLVEGASKKNAEQYCGRTDTNKFVVFNRGNANKNDIVRVKIIDCTSATLIGEII